MKSQKLKYFGHVTRHSSLEKDIMLGTMPGKRRQSDQFKMVKATDFKLDVPVPRGSPDMTP